MKNKFWLGILCLVLAVVVLIAPTWIKDKDFSVNFIDVGQGDSILIGCDGHYALVDGGGSTMDVTSKGQYVVLPYLKAMGVSRLDYCINTHPDADHIGGLFAVIDQLKVDELVFHGDYGDNQLQKQLLTLAANRQVPTKTIGTGSQMKLGDKVTITVLSPPENAAFDEDSVNDGSLVLLVSYGDFDVLLCGDVQGDQQLAMLNNQIDFSKIEVLQIPHHGSKNSYNENWYQAFNPEAVIISVGKDNSYGHPYQPVTAYWQNRGVKVLRTDLDGSIKITTDGRQAEFKTTVN